MAIIGLIIGGVLVGRDMIRNSEMLSIGQDATAYKTAVNMFRTQYVGLPGDLRNATTFWGVNSGGCPNGTGTTGTCNGNGDGLLTDGGGDNEMHRFWQHLALAKLIPGQFTGVAGPGGSVNAVPGVNAPRTKLVGVGFTAVNMGANSPGTPYLFTGDYSQCFQIGAAGNYQTENPFLTPSEALQMDTKYDDGLPGMGNYLARDNLPYNQGGNPNCTDSGASQGATAKYVTTFRDVACAILVRNAW